MIVCNLASNIAGTAYLPSEVPFPFDGCLLAPNQVANAVVQGSTFAHETGHWFGLLHTFDTCDPGDEVSDTPAHSVDSLTSQEAIPQASRKYCPPAQAENLFISDCSNVGPFMTQNNMNYNIESCLAYFSKGQVALMRGFIETASPRSTLPTSPGLAGTCVRNCNNRQCGSDDCGGTCGICAGACINFQCILTNAVCTTATPVQFSYEIAASRSSSIDLDYPVPTHLDTGNCVLPFGGNYNHPRWYSFTAPFSNQVTIQTTSSIDPILAVYSGSCNSLNCIIANDDDGPDQNPLVRFCVTAGQTYYVVVGGIFASTNGAFTVNFAYTPSIECCTPLCRGRQCGDNGCGGVCGSCLSYQTCSGTYQCEGVAPTPSPSLSGPIIICPHDLLKTVSGCFYSGSVGTPQVIVPTGGPFRTEKFPKGPYPVGVHEITYIAYANGFTASCKQTLNVVTTSTTCGQA